MKRLVVKIGGAAIDDAQGLAVCAQAITDLVEQGVQLAVVHGGGSQLTAMLKRVGMASHFVQGLRVTDAETRDVAHMVLAGSVNKSVVAALSRCGTAAVGMSGGDGGAFRARKKAVSVTEDIGFVGEIVSADIRLLESIWSMPAVPVISSLALGYDGEYYNVNADEMASACATACKANALVFLTDVAGVKGEDGNIIRWLSTRSVSELRDSSVVSGGMLPKLNACQQALTSGVGRVRILPMDRASLLSGFYRTQIDYGTEVVA
ncbi:MAG: acetylglutamate kinase [Acidobacteriaceae bacterium]